MSLWFLFALMTAAAVFAVLWPLGRRTASASGGGVAVYRNQLDELARERGAGLIGAREAEAARAEIGRRLLAAADAEIGTTGAGRSSSLGARRIAAVIALTLLPAGALALYGGLGSPALPGAPLAARKTVPLEAQPVDALIARVEAHLEANPQDGRGWEVLAPVYLRMGRFDDAVKAWRNVLRLNGANAQRETGYGEALIYAANGVVTGEARQAFERALKHDAKETRARFFLGLAAEQEGKREQAAALWRALLADAPADAPWIATVKEALARVEGAGPGADDVAAAETMAPEQRAAMIRGMVDRLAARLQADGSDIDGWLRLVRAWNVLGERAKAKAAAAAARSAIGSDEAKLRRLDELVRTLGLET